MSSSKRIVVNTIVGFVSQIIILVMGLIIPRIMLQHYGADVHGLTGTVTQIVGYVALLEAGIGASARNALFKPIKNNQQEDVSTILSVTRNYYRKVSIIYFFVILALSFLLPFVLKSKINYWVIFSIIIFEGLSSLFNFLFVDTAVCFLTCIGKTYVINGIDLFGRILTYGLKITLALLNVNIVFIQIAFFMASVFKAILYNIYMKRKHPSINYKCYDSSYRLPNRGSYVIIEVTWTVFSATDAILLSILVSTVSASIYSIYNLIFITLNGVITAIYNSIFYKLGEEYVKGIDGYQKYHDVFTSFIMSITTILISVAFYLAIPFVKIYTSNITDVNYIIPIYPLLFCIIPMLSWSRYVSSNLVCLAGYAKKVGIISIIEASINIVSSVIFVHFFGAVGVLFGTIISLPLKVVYCFIMSERVILKRNIVKPLLILLVNYLIFGATVLINNFIYFDSLTILKFILIGFILVITYSVVVFSLNILVNPHLFGSLINWIRNIKNRFIHPKAD